MSVERTIALLGDVHGDWSAVVLAAQEAKREGASALIQVGDLGWSASLLERAQNVPACLPVYAIDGNHEDFGWLAERTGGRTTTLASGLTFIARGDVCTIAGVRIAFLGGAESVDKKWRKTRFQAPEMSGEYLWWPDERITYEQADRLASGPRVDLFVTHTPPDRVIRKHFPPEGLRMFGLDPATWTDPSALAVEAAWNVLGRPPLVCGHMHRAVRDENITILDINQLALWSAQLERAA
jgi:predicted phosphodiesterase